MDLIPERIVAILDLFAGAGGFSLGAHRHTDNVLGLEWDDNAVATQHAAGMRCLKADITTLDPSDYVPDAVDHLHIHASPPCQSFSSAGKGAGRKHLDELRTVVAELLLRGEHDLDLDHMDANTRLAAEPARWFHDLMPDSISMEQVRGVLPLWEQYANDLELLGYHTWAGLLHSEQYGVPQTRTRAWLIASRHHEVSAPTPTHSRYHNRKPDRLDEGVLPWVSMAEALVRWEYERHADAGEDWSHFRSSAQKRATTRPIDTPAPTFAFGNDMALARFSNDEDDWGYGRPATTVCGDPRLSGPGRNDPNVSGSQYGKNARRITVAEAAVLQGLPPDFPFQGSKTSAFRMIGNSVNPIVAELVLKEAL